MLLKNSKAATLLLATILFPACSNDRDPDDVADPSAAAGAQSSVEGTWELIYFERDGKEVKLKAGGTHSVFTGDKFVLKRGEEVVAAGTSTFDRTSDPVRAISTYTEGPDEGKTFKSICQFDSDKIKFCRAGSPDDDYPTEFKTTPGSGVLVSIYRRVSR